MAADALLALLLAAAVLPRVRADEAPVAAAAEPASTAAPAAAPAPAGLLLLQPGAVYPGTRRAQHAHGAEAEAKAEGEPEWDPGPDQADDGKVLADGQADDAQLDWEADDEQPDGQSAGHADGELVEADGLQQRSSVDGQQVVPDSVAAEAEVLPMAAPLSMAGRGPPMTLSLEDMDYLTILRPPQAPKATGQPPRGPTGGTQQRGPKNKRKSNNNKGGKGTPKGKGSNKNHRPKAPPVGPAPTPGPPSPASSFDPYSSYEPPHPYGYGYGYSPEYDYPRYPDPVMTPEYQQATSYPEEERFRPLSTPVSRPMGGPLPAPPMGSMGPMGSTAAGPAPYGSYHTHGDYLPSPLPPLGQPQPGLGAAQPDQRPAGSGAVQVSQSLSLAEHHSTLDSNWASASAAAATTAGTPVTATPAVDASAATKRATLKDILVEDCPGAEELGYCDSPPRYPMQQVAEAIQRCSQLIEHMYAAPLEDRDPDTDKEGEGACQSVRRSLRPGYVRDAATGRWLVAVQSRGSVVQRVAVERCSAPGRPCARLADSKCARNLGFRNGARPTSCEQRSALVPVITWDPEAPTTCPRLRQARFPTACVCRMGAA